MNNLRFAFRQLCKAPAFTVTALATVAICLGANLAIFAVINSILLRPLPFPQSDRLVTIFNTYPKAGVENDGSSLTNYYERRGDIRVNTMPRKIVGVLPPDFRFLSSEARLFLPIRSRLEERTPQQRHSGGGGTHMIARLKPGATIAEAQAQIDVHNAAVEKDNPEAKAMAEAGFRSPVFSLHADHVRSIRPTLWLMQGGVFFLLLIGAVNLVNLLLIRASGRAKEMAIRQSMGASRRHVVSQVMVETVLLSVIGGLLGLVLGAWGIRLLEVLGADRLPLGAHIAFDGWLASIGLVGAVVLGIGIAVPIAWFNLSTHLAHALQSESRTGTISRAAQRLRHGFIVAQIALAFSLLAGAALLGLSLKTAMAVSPGFRSDHVLTGECTVSWDLQRERVGIVDRLLESIRQQPGIAATGTITNIPLSGDSGKAAVTPKGYVPPPGQSVHGHYSYAVHGEYFSALGIDLREGRFLTSADSHRAERVCVVDEDLARRYWPNGGALGQRIALGDEKEDAKLFTVVGVVGVVKQAALTEAQGQGAVYLPYASDRDEHAR